MGSDFITERNFWRQEFRSRKAVTNFSRSSVSAVATLWQWLSVTSFQHFMHFNCRAARLVFFFCLGLRTKAARNSFISGWSFGWSFTPPFPFTMQSASLPLAGGMLPFWFLTKHCSKSSLKCNHTFQFVIPDHTLGFLELRRHFSELRCSHHWWQDLENQVLRLRNLTILSGRMCIISSPLLLSSYAILHSNRQYFMCSRCSCTCQSDIHMLLSQ